MPFPRRFPRGLRVAWKDDSKSLSVTRLNYGTVVSPLRGKEGEKDRPFRGEQKPWGVRRVQ